MERERAIDPSPATGELLAPDQPGRKHDWLILALLVGVMALLAVCIAVMLLAR